MTELAILILAASTFALTVAGLRWRTRVEALEFELMIAHRDLKAFKRLFADGVDKRRNTK